MSRLDHSRRKMMVQQSTMNVLLPSRKSDGKRSGQRLRCALIRTSTALTTVSSTGWPAWIEWRISNLALEIRLSYRELRVPRSPAKPVIDDRGPGLFGRFVLTQISSTPCLMPTLLDEIMPWIELASPGHAPEPHSAVRYVPTSRRLAPLQMGRYSCPSDAHKSRNN
jgi:hypothetical protein